MRPFRFGCQAYNAATPAEWRDTARRAEALGYSSLMVADHYMGPGPVLVETNHPVQNLAAVPAIAVAAESTSTIKVGARVMCIDYRNPVVLIKEMATLGFFAEGRFELGLGAGWLQGEYDAMGVPWQSAGRRIDKLAEVIALAKAWRAGGELSIDGGHGVRAIGFEGLPTLPSTVPLMVGGGAKRVLSLAGREADIVSLNFDNSSGKIGPGVPTSGADATAEKIDWVRAAAGDRWPQVELEIGAYFTFVTDDQAALAGAMAPRFGMSPDALLAHPHGLIGTTDQIIDLLVERRERYGISYITVGASTMEAFAPVVARLAST